MARLLSFLRSETKLFVGEAIFSEKKKNSYLKPGKNFKWDCLKAKSIDLFEL